MFFINSMFSAPLKKVYLYIQSQIHQACGSSNPFNPGAYDYLVESVDGDSFDKKITFINPAPKTYYFGVDINRFYVGAIEPDKRTLYYDNKIIGKGTGASKQKAQQEADERNRLAQAMHTIARLTETVAVLEMRQSRQDAAWETRLAGLEAKVAALEAAASSGFTNPRITII